ncbi:MAG TPA: DUF2341 domain-containing protein, partial [Fibrobacteria bacterium]|nr:DUF2341 domain-containing protein [Fibrobacteria bacterium]
DLIVDGMIKLEGRVLPGPGMRVENLVACIPGAQVCVVPGADSVYTFPAAPQGAYEIVFLGGGAAHYLAMEVSARQLGTLHVRDVALGDSVPGARVPYVFYNTDRLDRSLSVMPVEYPAGLEPAWYAGKDFSSVSYLLLNDGHEGEVTAFSYFGQWRHSREIPSSHFTAPSLATRLGGFPVLIRLRAPEFDFTQARSDGGDVIVSDGTGRLLPHEIERWDAAAGKAEIWVRLDSLPLLPAGRNLVLHWGRDEAVPLTGGAEVFRAENGFIGVWHLADRTPDNRVLDSRGRFHGLLTEGWRTELADSVRAGEAVIAGGHRPGFTGGHVHMDHQTGLDVTSAFTLSLWARLWPSDHDHDQVLAAKMGPNKHEWRFRVLEDGTLDLEFGGQGGKPVGNVTSVSPVQRTETWRLYSATFDNGTVRLFLDGEEVPARVRYGNIPTSVLPQAAELRLGSDGNPMKNWIGSLDDFSYYSVPKSPDWIRTLYRTQKP